MVCWHFFLDKIVKTCHQFVSEIKIWFFEWILFFGLSVIWLVEIVSLRYHLDSDVCFEKIKRSVKTFLQVKRLRREKHANRSNTDKNIFTIMERFHWSDDFCSKQFVPKEPNDFRCAVHVSQNPRTRAKLFFFYFCNRTLLQIAQPFLSHLVIKFYSFLIFVSLFLNKIMFFL